MQAIAPVSIAELARLAGFDVASIRSYEEMGLLPKPRRRRGRSGDKAYHQEHLDRLMFIRRALAEGFELPVILDLTGAKGGLRTCNDIARVAEQQLADIRRDIAELRRLEANLSDLMDTCERKGSGRDCSILNTLRQLATSETGDQSC